MFWRRYAHGVRPLLVWAPDVWAADVTAAIHAAFIPQPIIFDISPLLSESDSFRDVLQRWAQANAELLAEWNEDDLEPR